MAHDGSAEEHEDVTTRRPRNDTGLPASHKAHPDSIAPYGHEEHMNEEQTKKHVTDLPTPSPHEAES